MDPVAAKVLFTVESSYELGGDLVNARPWVLLISPVILMKAFFLACFPRRNVPPPYAMMMIPKRH